MEAYHFMREQSDSKLILNFVNQYSKGTDWRDVRDRLLIKTDETRMKDGLNRDKIGKSSLFNPYFNCV